MLDGIKGDYLNTYLEVVPHAGYTRPIPLLPLPITDTRRPVHEEGTG